MKTLMKLLGFCILSLAAIRSCGQTNTFGPTTSGTAAQLPASCVAPQFYVATDTQKQYFCNALNGQTGVFVVNTASVVGLPDPGANGMVFRNALNSTRISTSTDIIGLFGSCSGSLYLGADGNCHSSGTGTVTSAGLTLPGEFSCSGSPITTSGTFSCSWSTQAANKVLAGPTSGGSSTPSFRLLVAADIPDISATYLTVASGATKSAVQQEAYSYATDTGSANAYAVTLSPVPSLVAGSRVVFIAAHANTGTSTLAVNGGSATAIVNANGGGVLSAGEITLGQVVTVIYDGTNFQFGGGAGGSGSGTVTNCLTAGALGYYASAGTTINCDAHITSDGSGNLSSSGSYASGIGSGVSGIDALGQGSAPTISTECSLLSVNCIVIYAPPSITSSYGVVKPNQSGTGLLRWNLSGSIDTESVAELSGAVSTGGSNATSWSNPITCSSGQHINQLTGSGVPTCSSDAGAGWIENVPYVSTTDIAIVGEATATEPTTTLTHNFTEIEGLGKGVFTLGQGPAGDPSGALGVQATFTGTTSNTDSAGTLTLSSGSKTYTFVHAWASAPICTASDTTAANAVQVGTSATTLTLTGTSSDVINYICIGTKLY